ncbi:MULTISPECIES: SDR family oxidoreductase [Virgibacillus]|uniref:NAD dependent epimerase/dehydratase n=1 Tax=Virgibacillus kapii TaxID=1638645 RepID=A0ABQ2DPK3_9BACI|nr:MULTISPECIES: SDR family oxidoreductase [Virgibacillus]EQB38798.1 hypothetical protein M948_00205 [Virgibacillus sp. CM-4]MYL43848.1 NAD(P)H-binding protein [Virgibacillus massiliensis]GGJ66147.1 NAD dependent epimerase/dehydratase [Virgibacillus kapii]
MRVLVIGANGGVGRHIVTKLRAEGHEPIAMVRKESQLSDFEKNGWKAVLADLESDFESVFNQIDAVIFAAGSGSNTGADKTIIIDQEGAIAAMHLAQKHSIKRFLLLSSMGADQPKEAPDSIKHYLYAKHRADEYLKQSRLAYTIIRAGYLTNEEEKGTVTLQDEENEIEIDSVTRSDVAAVMSALLTDERAQYKVLQLTNGKTPISNLFQ